MLGKVYIEKKKIQTDPSYIRYPGMHFNEVLEAEKTQKLELRAYTDRIHNAIIRFTKEIMYRLGTADNEFYYIGDSAFEFKVSIGYPPDFEGKNFMIRDSDVYWEIPYGLLSGHQNVASSKQQVYILAIKWLANPHLLNGEGLTEIGTNITSLIVFDGKGNELEISNLTTPVSVILPYKKSSGYNKEFLK